VIVTAKVIQELADFGDYSILGRKMAQHPQPSKTLDVYLW
jgi:hypothetical protein